MKLHPNGSTASTFREVGKSIRLRPLKFIDTKLDKQLPVPINRKCSLDMYMNKLKGICAKVVCDQEEEGTDNRGGFKKVVEEGGKATKLKKKNVKYTEWKATARAWRK